MLIEKSKPESTRVMPETICRSVSDTDDWFFFLHIIGKNVVFFYQYFYQFIYFFTIDVVWRPTPNFIQIFVTARK